MSHATRVCPKYNSNVALWRKIVTSGSKYAGHTTSTLTHWKKWYLSLFSNLIIALCFAAKHWLFNSKWPLFRNKTQTFQLKINLFFVVKHWLFSLQWTFIWTLTRCFPAIVSTSIHYSSTLSPFSPNSWRWVPKYPPFLGKCESWIFLKLSISSWILELVWVW